MNVTTTGSFGRCTTRSCATGPAEYDGDPSPVGMVENLVGAISAINGEPVADEGGHHVVGRQIAQQRVIDAHGLDGDCYTRLDGNLNPIGGLLGDVFAVFDHAFHDHADYFVDVLERFLAGLAPR